MTDIQFLIDNGIDYDVNNNSIVIYYKDDLQIYTNFTEYCYVHPDNENINMKLLLLNKFDITSILNILNNYDKRFNIDINIYDDIYNVFHVYNENTKINIDYNLIEKNSLNYKESNWINTKIPKELLFNENKIREILLYEIKKINTNFEHEHLIEPINNIYNLSLKLKLTSRIIEFEIKINSKLYPFLPPKFELVKPNIKSSLKYELANLDILKLNNWISTISLEWLIINIALILDPVIEDYIEINDKNNIIRIIEELEFLTDNKKVNLNLKKLITLPTIKKQGNFWKSGTGYGSHYENSNWNIEKYIQEKELKYMEIVNLFVSINDIISTESLHNNIEILKKSFIIDYIIHFYDTMTLLEIDNNTLLIKEINKLIKVLMNKVNNKFNILYQKIKLIVQEIELSNEYCNNDDNNQYQEIINIYNQFNNLEVIKEEEKKIENDYLSIMYDLQFKYTELDKNHLFISKINDKINPNCLKRIISEISSLKKSLPINFDSSIWFRVSKNNINIFTFLISGPKDTPYENGLFEFHSYLPIDYPQKPPSILLKTTGDNSVRFNPNLYSSGKVCLSLLGTWDGNASEKWNPNNSTFLQVLISIQSLIFIEQPYFNEPGYETKINTKSGEKESLDYNSKLYVDTLKWTINNQITNPIKDYEDVIINHFKLKKNDIINFYTNKLNEITPSFKKNLEEQINIFKNII
jgi:ubiquitin-protein ligase